MRADAPEPRRDPGPGAAGRSSAHALRASDADRERTADVLRTAGGEGRLTVDELDERLDAAYRAVTRDDLAGLTTDLVVPEETERSPRGRPGPGMPVRPGTGGDEWIVSVMGGNDRTGRWRLGRRLTVVNVMGGSDLDLCDAELSAPVTDITVVSLMGGSELRIPEGVRVETSKISIMGGSDVHDGDGELPPDAPVVRLRLISIMGGSEVRGGRRDDRGLRQRLLDARRDRRAGRIERREAGREERIRRRDEHRG